MAHDPKLTVYTITLEPINNTVENSNRWLFRNLIGEANTNILDDSFIFIEVFRKLIAALDTPEMFSDAKSKKCITASQPDLEDPTVPPNITIFSNDFIIEGKIEGGAYGRKRNKTSTLDKTNKTDVDIVDAITDDFYFLLYMPLSSNKMTIMIQSYSDDSIDSVMKHFLEKFFRCDHQFKKPKMKRFIPLSIIEDFKRNSTVSNLEFTTEIPGETLLEGTNIGVEKNFKVSVKITPIGSDLTLEQFEETVGSVNQALFTRLYRLRDFTKKRGMLRDTNTNSTSPFDLGTNFEIQPSILLSKYIDFPNGEIQFDLIKQYCLVLLDNIILQIYSPNAIQER